MIANHYIANNSCCWRTSQLHEQTRQYESTVEPPNEGHFGSGDFVLYLEAVLWWEVPITIVSTRVISIRPMHSECPLHRDCPLVGGSIIGGSTV